MAENRKIFKQIARREYWSKCNALYSYHWIRLDKLYKLMESFFQILNLFLNNWAKTEIYSTNNNVGFMQARWGGICADQHAF